MMSKCRLLLKREMLKYRLERLKRRIYQQVYIFNLLHAVHISQLLATQTARVATHEIGIQCDLISEPWACHPSVKEISSENDRMNDYLSESYDSDSETDTQSSYDDKSDISYDK